MSDKRKQTSGSPQKTKRQKTAGGLGKVLLLGCGMCAPPLVFYLDAKGAEVTVASRTLAKANAVVGDCKNATGLELNVEAPGGFEKLDPLVQAADVVISLLPYTLHVQCAKVALKHNTHFCTASYISEAMEALHEEAKKKNLTFLNECGVDPGLDHMSAQKIIDEVHAKGGKILSFTSVCGGLPAPSCNDNPMGYKLSWSPRGVLMAGRNNAVFLNNGEKVEAPGSSLYTPEVYRTDSLEGIDYEWYPNRDSVKYKEIYGLKDIKTLIRGTYRNKDWCKVLEFLSSHKFNLMEDEDFTGLTLAGFTNKILGGSGDPRATAVAKGANQKVLEQLEWMGLFLDKPVPAAKTRLDVLSGLWQERMQYAEGEQDMLIMKHTFEVEWRSAARETITSTMVDFGQQDKGGQSSMARTVSLPLAMAVEALLRGDITERGVIRPTSPQLYNLILAGCAKEGIVFKEETLPTRFWLRGEVKPGEERAALTPSDCKKLLSEGVRVAVERSAVRCFGDEAYAAAGCEIVPAGSWVDKAGYSDIILGLKELPDTGARRSRHIFFAHCFKEQADWKETMTHFVKAQGHLWDLEYLTDDKGRRVAAFGRAAGQVGMALGVLKWALQQLGEEMTALKSWGGVEAMVADVKKTLAKAEKKAGRSPSTLILGALGRCGGGAADVAAALGLQTIIKWDMAETKKGAPFPELLQHDILLNAILLRGPVQGGSWLDIPQVKAAAARTLSVFVDVSCDLSNPYNPFPLDKKGNTMTSPSTRLDLGKEAALPLDFIGIDHLPSLVPTDSSNEFSAALLPHLMKLGEQGGSDAPVWKRAEKLFQDWAAKL